MTDLRELLILILALSILFSLLRAAYVIHRRRKGQIRLSIDKMMAQEAGLDEPEFSELPNGGARVVPVDEMEGSVSEQAGGTAPDAEDPPAEDNVPILLDPVAVAPVAEAAVEAVVKPAPATREPPQRKRKKKWKGEIPGSNGKDRERSDFEMELGAVSMTAGERIGSDSPKPSGIGKQAESKPESEAISADRIITINVVAGGDRVFNGRELWDFLRAAGLRHDEMKILSKTEGNREDGKPIFRVANIVNPGTFDADAIDDFSTPGISLFMLLPAPIDNLLAFEQMLTVARRFAEVLNGQLLDFKRREMTARGIEQARRRIREFDMGTTGSPSVSNGI